MIKKGEIMEEILLKLKNVKRKGPNSASASCPANNDKKPSLSITKRDGKVLMKCHAGCSFEEICKALNLTSNDLFDESKQSAGQIEATYDYLDEFGNFYFRWFVHSERYFSGDNVWKMENGKTI